MGLRPCSTAAEPALSMCCCSLSFCTSRHNPGQQKMKVEGSAEGWARGKRALFLIIPAICLNKPKKIFPRGNQPLGISCRQLQLLSLQHGLALAGDNEERKQDFFPLILRNSLPFFLHFSRLFLLWRQQLVGSCSLQCWARLSLALLLP